MIEVADVILAICALRRCLSFPGNGGLLSMAELSWPLNAYFINLAAIMCYGFASGSWTQSSSKLSVTQ